MNNEQNSEQSKPAEWPLTVEVEQSIEIDVSGIPNFGELLLPFLQSLGCGPHRIGFEVGQLALKASKRERWMYPRDGTVKRLDNAAIPERRGLCGGL